MITFFLRTLVNALSLYVATLFIDGFDVEIFDERTYVHVGWFVVFGAILAVLNAVVRPIVKLISLPLYVLTLGLFSFGVSAIMLILTSFITQEYFSVHLEIGSYFIAVIASVLIGITNTVFSFIVNKIR